MSNKLKIENQNELFTLLERLRNGVKVAEQMNEMAKRSQEMFVEHLKTYNSPDKIDISLNAQFFSKRA